LPQRNSPEIRFIAISLANQIKPGDSLADELLNFLQRDHLAFESGDILIVKHKIVSKAEGRLVELATVKPSAASVAEV